MILVNLQLDSQRVSDIFLIFNVSGDGSMSAQVFVKVFEDEICFTNI